MMTRFLLTMTLLAGYAAAQGALPSTPSNAAPGETAAVPDNLAPAELPGGKVGLVRGVLKHLDPIHDRLLIHTFGGGNMQIAFDPRTQLVGDTSRTQMTAIPAGSVVSVDTVIDNGKLFARSVRIGEANVVELNGQVVSYDAGKSRLNVRDPISPQSVGLRITPSTVIVKHGEAASPQALSSGMLVRVWFSPAQHTANNVEILAEPGSSFTFAGRVVAVDLRSRVLDLSNDTDRSIRELALGTLDNATLGLLREGANVSIQAEFDGERYNVRSVTVVSSNP